MLIMNVCSRCSTAAAESEFVNGARVDFDVFFFLLSIRPKGSESETHHLQVPNVTLVVVARNWLEVFTKSMI